MDRFSIKTHLRRMRAPNFNVPCLYFIRVSRLIRSTTEPGEATVNNYNECTKLKRRIKRRDCKGCTQYKPITQGSYEDT